MHNFEVAKGFNDTTILFCRNCGQSYRLITYRVPSHAVWEAMAFETPDENAMSVTPCRIEATRAGGNDEED